MTDAGERALIVQFLRKRADTCFRMADLSRNQSEKDRRTVRGAILQQMAHYIEDGEHLVNAPTSDADH